MGNGAPKTGILSASQGGDGEWMDIASAPKKGRPILAAAPIPFGETECEAIILRWSRGAWRTIDRGHNRRPTHWLPIPELPRRKPVSP